MNKTLVILAAGMGSRFGGLKQIEPVGPSKEIIADYSVYDAIRAGFNKVVFVIKEENYEYFKEHISSKYEDKIQVEYAFQSLDKIPSDVTIPPNREKMWGTTHALLCAKEHVHEPFVMINADDFYGSSPYKIASDFFENNHDEYEYLTVNYPFIKASSKNGKVNRGLVTVKDGYVTDMDECYIEILPDKIIATSYKTKISQIIEENHPVSVNFFALKPSIFALLEEDFNEFIHGNLDESCESFIPNTIKKYMALNKIKFKASISDSSWLGITYKEDLEELKSDILKLIAEKEYPENLWGK